jgi:hypothetical protein
MPWGELNCPSPLPNVPHVVRKLPVFVNFWMRLLPQLLQKLQLPVDRRWGDIPHPLADVPLDVAWEHLPQGAAMEGSLPEATVTFVLSVAAKPPRSPAEVARLMMRRTRL